MILRDGWMGVWIDGWIDEIYKFTKNKVAIIGIL
jgi:hypothetical protein